MPYPFENNPFENYITSLRNLRREQVIAYKLLCDTNVLNESRGVWKEKYNGIKLEIKNLINNNQIPARVNDVYLGEIEVALERFEQEYPKPKIPTKCMHAEYGLRQREHSDGTIHIFTQCFICGGILKSHKKTDVQKWNELPLFEEENNREEDIEYRRWWELRNDVLKDVVGDDGKYPEFDHDDFKRRYELSNPRPISPLECNHEHNHLTLRKYSKSNNSVVVQCLSCGKHVKSVPKKSIEDVSVLPNFDENMEEQRWKQYSNYLDEFSFKMKNEKVWFEQELHRKICSGEIRRVNKTTFGSYYDSSEWRMVRKQIFLRDEYTCQACGNEAQCVHHLTYDRLGRENDLDLISLCNTCHDKVHSYQDRKWFGYRLTPLEIRDISKLK